MLQKLALLLLCSASANNNIYFPLPPKKDAPSCGTLSVSWLDKIGHGLGLLIDVFIMSTVAVVVSVAIILWADIFHLIVASALGAALSRAFAGSHQPDDNMRVCRATGAANVLLITERLDNNRVLERAFLFCYFPQS